MNACPLEDSSWEKETFEIQRQTRFLGGAFICILWSYWPCGLVCACEACDDLTKYGSDSISYPFNHKMQNKAGMGVHRTSFQEEIIFMLLLEDMFEMSKGHRWILIHSRSGKGGAALFMVGSCGTGRTGRREAHALQMSQKSLKNKTKILVQSDWRQARGSLHSVSQMPEWRWGFPLPAKWEKSFSPCQLQTRRFPRFGAFSSII